uniref:Uncharacterized protein n=1 Tax=Graphocephala atropunctata TaxID=36148 RepID=A0A1B6MG03_9HEMI
MSKPNQWQDNQQKRHRERGEKYLGWSRAKNSTGKRGTEREERKLGPTCTSQFCLKSKKRKCQDVAENSRKLMFTKFWETLSWDQKKIYVCSLVKKSHTTESVGEESRRQFTLSYSLKTEDGHEYPVCKVMFLDTNGRE